MDSVFLSLPKQLEGFIGYNEWLEKEHSKLLIPKEQIIALERQIGNLPTDTNEVLIISYCHNSDVVLSAEKAWEYVFSYRKTWKSSYIQFKNGYMKPVDNEPKRPTGFYIMKLPPEDNGAVGKKFQGKSVAYARENLKGDWGMGFEGIQLLGITHPHYPELMDGGEFPFIDLPGLAVAPYGDGVFYDAPSLCFGGGELRLSNFHIRNADSFYGSGSLQQCQV